MHTRLFDTDPLTGSTTLYHYDPADKSFSFETVEDVEPLIDHNRRQHNDATDAHWKGDMHKVASLPLSIWFKLKKEGILDDKKAFRRWLNDSANSAFRVRSGRV